MVRTRLKVDFKAKFEEVAKQVRYGAGNGDRTRDLFLGKEAFYH
jgi:hypothetical protein